jgi:hypothetical protein
MEVSMMNPQRVMLTPRFGRRLSALALAALLPAAGAATLDEAVGGDFSGNRLAPTVFTLDAPTGGVINTFQGRIGRVAGVVDVDYINIIVPAGYLWTGLTVGASTVGGGSGSFIGFANGPTMPVLTTATTAAGLLGWKLYNAGDAGTDILDDMAVPNNGSSGYSRPLPAGSYTFWIQELATGDFPYSFSVNLAPVPEASSALLMLLGLSAVAVAAKRARKR